jgi:HSP20 family protein
MAIIRWDPFTALSRMDTEFDDLVRRTWGTPQSAGFVPAVDMVRDGNDVLITLELPGVDIENEVDIEVAPRRLTISGERSTESERTEGHVMVRELRSGSFRREFALPEHVGADDIEAGYDRGMLTVRVRNVARPQPEPTKIAVTSTAPASEPAVETAEAAESADPAVEA